MLMTLGAAKGTEVTVCCQDPAVLERIAGLIAGGVLELELASVRRGHRERRHGVADAAGTTMRDGETLRLDSDTPELVTIVTQSPKARLVAISLKAH